MKEELNQLNISKNLNKIEEYLNTHYIIDINDLSRTP